MVSAARAPSWLLIVASGGTSWWSEVRLAGSAGLGKASGGGRRHLRGRLFFPPLPRRVGDGLPHAICQRDLAGRVVQMLQAAAAGVNRAKPHGQLAPEDGLPI